LRYGLKEETAMSEKKAFAASEETIISVGGGGGVVENFGVVNRINADEAARNHKSAALVSVANKRRRPRRGRRAQNTHGGDNCKIAGSDVVRGKKLCTRSKS
jgi:hypothetical protein